MKLDHALFSFTTIDDWTIDHAERVFSLCIYASWILDMPQHVWFYVFKFMRRRMRLVQQTILHKPSESNSPQITRNSPAMVWPSIRQLWRNWVSDIKQHSGRVHRPPNHRRPIHVFSDASKTGYGGIAFGYGGTYKLSATSGKWSEVESKKWIHELELLALLNTLRELVPEGTDVHLVVDNTTVRHCTIKRRSSNYNLNAGVGTLLKSWNVLSIQYIQSAKNPADTLSRGLQLNHQLVVDAVLDLGVPGVSTDHQESMYASFDDDDVDDDVDDEDDV
jgi:hypothetical protein